MLPPSNNPVLCGYPPASDYLTGAEGDGVAVCSMNPTQSYHAGLYSLSQEDRWLNEREQNYYFRDRRHERRAMPAHTQPTSIPRSASHSAFTGFMAAPDLVQHPTFQSPYVRPSHEIYNPMSHWEGLDIPIDHSSMNMSQIRRFEEKPTTWSHHIGPQITPMDHQQFNNMMISSGSSSPQAIYTPPPEQAIPLNGYTFPHRLSPLPSPTPSPFEEDVKPVVPTIPSPVQQSRRKASDGSETGKTCSHCHATSTPLWRRDPSTMKPLCNACGLYLQQRNKLRPQELIDADGDGSSSDESDANYLGPECSHCHTHRTSVWRRSKSGDQLCNACGVYARLRGKPRPLSLKRKKIRPRSAKKTSIQTPAC